MNLKKKKISKSVAKMAMMSSHPLKVVLDKRKNNLQNQWMYSDNSLFY